MEAVGPGNQRRKEYRLSQYVAIGELAVALPLYGIYLLPFRAAADGSQETIPVLMAALCVAFLLLPIIALAGVSRPAWWGYLAMGLFPAVAGVVFGVTAMPLVQYLYGLAPQFTAVYVAIINAGVSVLSAYLYRAEKE